MLNEIDEDLQRSLDLLKNRFGKTAASELYKTYYRKLYWYRKLTLFLIENENNFNLTTLQKNGLKKIAESIQDYIEFIWIIYYGRLKISMSCVRNAVDLNGRGLSLLSGIPESNSFSENIDQVTKKIRTNNELYIPENRQRKIHKTFLTDNFNTQYKNLYWELSGLVHGKEIIVEDVSGYLYNCVNSIEDIEDASIQKYIRKAEDALCFSIQYLVLINFHNLSQNYNNYEFDLILDTFPINFKTYKKTYLLNF